MPAVQIHQQSIAGILWIGGWLFTIGFLHLTFWKGVTAIIAWPYYIGLIFSHLAR